MKNVVLHPPGSLDALIAAGSVDKLLDVLFTGPRCEKGCCMAPATCLTNFYSTDGMRGCDDHSFDAPEYFTNAEEIRRAHAFLVKLNKAWWGDWCIRPPTGDGALLERQK